jgi:hypothetical protein
MQKSELMKIIREEVEVVLTNAEAVEVFDLDPAALLDEMMDEGLPFMKDVERARSGKLPPEQEKQMKAASDAMKTRAGSKDRLNEEDDDWIQDAEADIERRGTEGVCTGEKFGGPTCRPGTKRYNLAKTFRKMARKRKKG